MPTGELEDTRFFPVPVFMKVLCLLLKVNTTTYLCLTPSFSKRLSRSSITTLMRVKRIIYLMKSQTESRRSTTTWGGGVTTHS